MLKLQLIEVEPGEAGVLAAMKCVHGLFEQDQSFALVPAGDQAARAAAAADLPLHSAEPCAVLVTSGSTGAPRAVELSVSALATAAEQSAVQLQNQAVWLTCLPVTGIGGLNTVVRSALAGTAPTIWPGVAGGATFTAETVEPFIRATVTAARKQRLAAAASLVPAQLFRIAAAPNALAALAELDYVLVGGGRTPANLIEEVRATGVNAITTYGATETCGGVVYNGQPLPGVEVTFANDGEILLAGEMIADWYRDGSVIEHPWHSGDVGEMSGGKLVVRGRLDDMVKVAGHKLNLSALAQSLELLPGVDQIAVIAVDDDEYGQLPVVAFSGQCPETTVLDAFRNYVEVRMPVKVLKLAEVPQLPNGKPDRQRIAAL